jgi:serine/threonine protein phosphatase PrpC
MLRLKVAYQSDKGKVRVANEDSVLVRQIGEMHLLAVADGLGGHNAGEIASKMALIELEEFIKAHLQVEPISELLKQAFQKANQEIYLLAQENREYQGMSTTLVAALVSSGKAWIGNVGDSRAYVIGEDIIQITRDHSLVQELLEKNEIGPEEARNHLQKNIVTRVLGVKDEVQGDYYSTELRGETLLLCSDGLTDVFNDEDIQKIVFNTSDLERTATRLVEEANAAGGRDNISVILAREEKEEVLKGIPV